MNKPRLLKAEEIEVRIGSINEKGATLLLYKDARVDQNILDEWVGYDRWQRSHKELKGNIYCGVGIIFDIAQEISVDKAKVIRSEWVWKWDAGTESQTEKVKGEASDSFKRACVNWGIGRELYTAPFIWIPASKVAITKNAKGKLITYDKFKVAKIKYNDSREIEAVAIANEKTNEVVFVWQA